MREKLRFDNLPPAGVILPFLLVAPLFALAGLLALLAGGLEGALARWHPHTIAAVHLFTLGYLLPVMIAALMQMLPVLTGRHLRAGTATGFLLQLLLFAGAAAFATGLGGISAGWSRVAFLALLAGLLLFGYRIGTGVIPTLRERGAGREMLLAVGGLVVTAALGLRLLAAWAWPDISLPRQLTNLHAGWAMLGWVAPLIIAAGRVVIPMFQNTDALPAWTRWLGPASLLGMLLASGPSLRPLGIVVAASSVAAFALAVLQRQATRRPVPLDATSLLFRTAMGALLASVAGGLWLLNGSNAQLELLAVALFLAGFAGGCVLGMSMKIVPFLLRLHLQKRLWQLALPARALPSFKALGAPRVEMLAAWLHALATLLLVVAVPLHGSILFAAAVIAYLAAFASGTLSLFLALLRAVRLRREMLAP